MFGNMGVSVPSSRDTFFLLWTLGTGHGLFSSLTWLLGSSLKRQFTVFPDIPWLTLCYSLSVICIVCTSMCCLDTFGVRGAINQTNQQLSFFTDGFSDEDTREPASGPFLLLKKEKWGLGSQFEDLQN